MEGNHRGLIEFVIQKFVGRIEKNKQDLYQYSTGVSDHFYIGPMPLLWPGAA